MIPMNNLTFGWNQIDYIQFSALLQLAIFDTTFVFFCVWGNLWSHFNIYEIQHFPNSNSNGRPSYIRAKHISNTLNNRKSFSVQFTFNLLSIYFQTRFCDQPSLIWFLNISISIPQLNHFVCCYFINLSKINVCRRILLAPLDIETQNWPHFSVSDFSPLILHCQRSWLSSWQHVVTICRDQLDII